MIYSFIDNGEAQGNRNQTSMDLVQMSAKI